jgi:hypothetical protein
MSKTSVALYVSSSDRYYGQSKSSTDFVVRMSKTITNVSNIEVTDVVIPKSYYNVNINNNTFRYRVNKFPYSESFTVIVPPYNYTKTSLAAAFQVALNNTFSDESGRPISWVGLDSWEVSYDSASDIFKLDVLATQYISSLTVRIQTGSLANLLGLGTGSEDILNYTSGSQLENPAPSPVIILSIYNTRFKLLEHHRYLVISSNILTQDINTSYINSSKKLIEIDSTNNLLEYDTYQYDSNNNPFVVGNISVNLKNGFYTQSEIATSLTSAIFEENSPPDQNNNISVAFSVNIYTISKTSRNYLLKNTSTILDVLGFQLIPIDIITGSVSGTIVNTSIHNNILSKVITHNVYPFIFSNNVNIDRRDYAPGFSFNLFDLQLRNERDQIVDLNGEEWSCSIVCDIH